MFSSFACCWEDENANFQVCARNFTNILEKGTRKKHLFIIKFCNVSLLPFFVKKVSCSHLCLRLKQKTLWQI